MQLDKEEIKPLAEILGYAVMDSQRLEYSIAFMMLLLNNKIDISDNEQNELIDSYMESLSKKTLGSLIKELKKIIEVSDVFEAEIVAALDARNYIIHRFFNDQEQRLMTKRGLVEALDTLKAKRKILYDFYFLLDPMITALMKHRGMNIDTIMDDLARKFEIN